MSTPATAPGTLSDPHRCMYLLASMMQLGEVQGVMHLSCWRLLHPRQGYAGGSAARIDFQCQRLEPTLLHYTILEANHKGVPPVDHGASAREQQARLFRSTRHQWLFAFVKHEDHRPPPF